MGFLFEGQGVSVGERNKQSGATVQHACRLYPLEVPLEDPLGLDPIVVTGSANFSDDSQKENDENMIIIRGDQRVADIYFTEFNRLFNHYYFRSVMETLNAGQPPAPQDDSLFFVEEDTWLTKYAPGKLRFKRVQEYKKMQGFA